MCPKDEVIDSLEDEIVKTIFKFFSTMRAKNPLVGTPELSMSQMHCLMTIGNKEPSMAQIASDLQLSMPTVTVTIDKLVGEGYVERKADAKDRRVIRVKLTSRGIKIMQKMQDRKAAIIRDLISKLSISDRKKTKEVFLLLLNAIENK